MEEGAGGGVAIDDHALAVLDDQALGHRFDDGAQPALGVAAGGLGLVQRRQVFQHPDRRVGLAGAAEAHRRRPGDQRHAPAVGPVDDDVVAHAGDAAAQRLVDGQFLDRVGRPVGAEKAVELREGAPGRRRRPRAGRAAGGRGR